MIKGEKMKQYCLVSSKGEVFREKGVILTGTKSDLSFLLQEFYRDGLLPVRDSYKVKEYREFLK